MGYRGGPIIRLSQRRFGVLCLLGYVALAWSMRFDMRLGDQIASLFYPLDTFSMYGRMPGRDSSYPLLRDGQGAVYRVTDFSAFTCREAVTGSTAQCADKRGIPYHYDEAAEYIRLHPGGGDLAVELITRTWEIRAGAAPRLESDCVIAHCTVAR
ncbi:MAG: hypothetical protein ABI629_02920 [bacterium]